MLALGVLLALQGGFAVEPLDAPAPRPGLAAPGRRVLRDGQPLLDLWFRSPLPTAAATKESHVLYPTLKPRALAGAVRFHEAGVDFRAQKYPAGLYTLRYMVQPDDGDHFGLMDSRDLLVMTAAADDPTDGDLEADALIKASSKLHGGKHPGVLYLVAPQDGEVPRVRRDAKENRTILETEAPTGEGKPLRLALVIQGKLAEMHADDGADFTGLTWIDPPDLKGKVVLVRWWTNGCALCSASAPKLEELSKRAAVVAVYHPKPPRDVSPEAVRANAKAIGMPGTLAVDRDWAVLDRWMPPGKRSFTSLTFVLDKKGRVRYVHPGGTIDDADAKTLSQQIEALLAEK